LASQRASTRSVIFAEQLPLADCDRDRIARDPQRHLARDRRVRLCLDIDDRGCEADGFTRGREPADLDDVFRG
jgi:hypothetical protein